MYARERQRQIVRLARDVGRVDVAPLSAELGVTPETIRRDLTTLEEHGLLRRVHGGAIPVELWGLEDQLAAREVVMTQEKARIAEAALAELPEQGAILIESGSTPARFAELLPRDRELTVITPALPVAQLLAARPNLTVLTLGGRVRSTTLGEVDGWAVQRLREVYADVAFLGTNGLSATRGLTTPDHAEAELKALMLRAARHRVLLVDHSKIGVVRLHRYGDLGDVDVVITDTGLAPELAEELESHGPRVVRA
ncbi:DeoR/GlpR family DNA-binding transcription regulator [Kutzneria albida]|uniref:Lactose phosphotransferase system repressor n=1 Tax=Kutzneria albida DSM 43870 TaxID=1449976 RepID=W5W4G8_9PSEU|nr:DeoR/GlpR family DNA-binding transcription regulator [Kutzneria albida]AHH95371.1 DeoR family transcription regulator [Kutzneria albida DSM 43870]